jgi:predicted DNA-binding transcriptional regulator YafY
LQLRYRKPGGAVSTRIVRLLQIEFWGQVLALMAWFEARGDFRVFRTIAWSRVRWRA